MELAITALGLVLVFEGLLYALVPGHLRRMMQAVQGMTDEQLRTTGTLTLGLGVLVIWLGRTFLQS